MSVRSRRFNILSLDNIMLILLLFAPFAIILELMHASQISIFITTAIAIVPLATFTGKATEQLSAKVGAGLGSFLNASLGKAAELIIDISALREGLHEMVKASLTGAIIGNVLLLLGCSSFWVDFRAKSRFLTEQLQG